MPPTVKKDIRLDPTMESKCLSCGGEAKLKENSRAWYICTNCKKDYYRIYCWNCNATVDSRDTETPRCSECGWCKCTCEACRKYGCSTNPYIHISSHEPMSDEELNELEEIRQFLALEAEREEQRYEDDLEQMRKEYPLDEDEHY